MPHAISTFNLSMTIVTPPSCPNRFTTTNNVAINQPQPHDMSIYSLCSDHCTHILIPSSKNVETRHRRAKCGRTCFDERVTYMTDMDEIWAGFYYGGNSKLSKKRFLEIGSKSYNFLVLYRKLTTTLDLNH